MAVDGCGLTLRRPFFPLSGKTGFEERWDDFAFAAMLVVDVEFPALFVMFPRALLLVVMP
jgi:hypothetical protein